MDSLDAYFSQRGQQEAPVKKPQEPAAHQEKPQQQASAPAAKGGEHSQPAKQPAAQAQAPAQRPAEVEAPKAAHPPGGGYPFLQREHRQVQ